MANEQLKVFSEAAVEWIGGGNGQDVVLKRNRDAHARDRDVSRNQDDGGVLRRRIRKADVWQAQLEAKRPRDLFFRGEIQSDEHRTNAFTRAALFGERRLQILSSNQTGVNQALA
jgi:hypothetical protein